MRKRSRKPQSDDWVPGYGERIKRAREALGLMTQAAFAKRFGYTAAAVAQWESETTKPSGQSMARMMLEGISQRFLLKNEGEMFSRTVENDDEYELLVLLRGKPDQERRTAIHMFKRFLRSDDPPLGDDDEEESNGAGTRH